MGQLSFTNADIDNAEPGATSRRYRFDGDGVPDGLHIVVMPSAIRRWQLKYRMPGTTTWQFYTFGTFGPAKLGLMDCAGAIRRAIELQTQITKGINPAETRKQARIKPKKLATVRDVMDAYLIAKKNARSIYIMSRMAASDIYPAIGSKVMANLTDDDIGAFINNIAERAPTKANRVMQLLRAATNWSVSRRVGGGEGGGWSHGNIALGYRSHTLQKWNINRNHERKNNRHLDSRELELLWNKIPGYGEEICWQAVRMVAASCGQRVMTILEMRWEDVNEFKGEWVQSRTKVGGTHTVPIGQEMARILTRMRTLTGDEGLVFPSPMDERRMIPYQTLNRLTRNFYKDYKLEPFGPRMLRASCKTMMVENGANELWLDLLMDHRDGLGTASRTSYNKHTYSKEKAQTMALWDETLATIISGSVALKVVN